MGFSNKADFEFTVSEAEIENVPRSETDIKRLIFHTEDVPKGKITVKPTKDKETEENGIPKTIPDAAHYTLEDLPENVINALQKAQEIEELNCVATVTKAQDEGEEPNFFIRDENMETLEVRLIQDDSGE